MIFWPIILIACFTGTLSAQKAKEVVSVSVSETFLAPGQKGIVIIRVMVEEGYHIQANKVTNESLIPVSLEVTPNRLFTINKALFPPYKPFRLEGAEDELNVFDSIFIIQLPVKATINIQEGRYALKARISYQACNEKTCLFPRKIDFEFAIIVKKRK
jgi:hypothetical protein